MNHTPWFWLVAGPKGAGKSTTACLFLPRLEFVVNPDDLAIRLSPQLPSRSALQAGRQAVTITARLIASCRDFARETTLSGRTIIVLLARLNSIGYRIGLIYIGLRNAKLAVERVVRRRAEGGHDVPAADVRRRYYRSLSNLPNALELADRAVFLDNSLGPARAKRVLEVVNGAVIFGTKRLPDWLRRGLRVGKGHRLAVPPKRR